MHRRCGRASWLHPSINLGRSFVSGLSCIGLPATAHTGWCAGRSSGQVLGPIIGRLRPAGSSPSHAGVDGRRGQSDLPLPVLPGRGSTPAASYCCYLHCVQTVTFFIAASASVRDL